MLSLLLLLLTATVVANPEGVKFSLRNLCGEPVRLYWLGNGDAVPQTQLPLKNSSSVTINSFFDHEFAVWYARGSEDDIKMAAMKRGVGARPPTTHDPSSLTHNRMAVGSIHSQTKFRVGETNDVIVVQPQLRLVRDDVYHQVVRESARGMDFCASPTGWLDETCFAGSLRTWLEKWQNDLDFERSLYTSLRGQMEDYECVGPAPEEDEDDEDAPVCEVFRDAENKDVHQLIQEADKELLGMGSGRKLESIEVSFSAAKHRRGTLTPCTRLPVTLPTCPPVPPQHRRTGSRPFSSMAVGPTCVPRSRHLSLPWQNPNLGGCCLPCGLSWRGARSRKLSPSPRTRGILSPPASRSICRPISPASCARSLACTMPRASSPRP